MRQGLGILLALAIAFGSGYWYFTVNAVCDVPIAYRVGTIDPMFELSHQEAKAAISVAESMWEDATGRNLFTYTDDADFTINFVFDERQKLTLEEQDLRDELDQRENRSDDVKEQYEYLLEKYGDLKHSYEKQSAAYDEQLDAHNAEVERWNRAGGAPPDIFDNLQMRQGELSEERTRLNAIAHQLNQLVNRMNAIGSEGNALIDDYNEIVAEYNSKFNREREFTQGDYQGDLINIYQFNDMEELHIVLAHELGHALSIDHVEGEESIMYHFMDQQSVAEGLSVFDIDAFERTCGDDGFSLWSIL